MKIVSLLCVKYSKNESKRKRMNGIKNKCMDTRNKHVTHFLYISQRTLHAIAFDP